MQQKIFTFTRRIEIDGVSLSELSFENELGEYFAEGWAISQISTTSCYIEEEYEDYGSIYLLITILLEKH